MSKAVKKKKNNPKRSKNGLPVLNSDQEFLSAFKKNKNKNSQEIDPSVESNPSKNKPLKNKHGVPVLESASEHHLSDSDLVGEEDFETLLNEYYKTREIRPIKKPTPVPLKKRLKRYPSVEVELDLHGYRGMEAQVRLRSFLYTCKKQGLFTARIIVGKGLHSDNGPVLPDIVEDLLKQLKTLDLVIWYEWDKKNKSKSGAVIVYLKQFDQFE